MTVSTAQRSPKGLRDQEVPNSIQQRPGDFLDLL